MLIPEDLASLIKTNLEGIMDATSANTILGNTIATYVFDNTEFTFSWIATQTAPPPPGAPIPDPIIIANGVFDSLTITLTPSGESEPESAKEHTKNEVVVGMTSATYTIYDSGFSVALASMGSSPTLDTLDLQIEVTDSQDDALLDLSTKIINWVKQLSPTAPVSGTRTDTIAGIVYTGAGIVTSIV